MTFEQVASKVRSSTTRSQSKVSEASGLDTSISHKSALPGKIEEVNQGSSRVAPVHCKRSCCHSFHLGFIRVLHVILILLHPLMLLGMGIVMQP